MTSQQWSSYFITVTNEHWEAIKRAHGRYKNMLYKVKNHSIINFYAAHNNTLIMCARKRTELTIRDKVGLIKASSGKSHRQLAVETDENDDDDTNDSRPMSVIKKYSFHETMAAVSVHKDFTADRCLDDILHSMFNIVKIKSTGQQSSINSFIQLQ